MTNLSKIEKEIISFIVDTDIINDEDEIETYSKGGISQKNGSTIETLISALFLQDPVLKDVGLMIDFNSEKNKYSIFISEDEKDASPILGNWNVFQKVNYFLVKIANFLDQLERDGYLDRVALRNSFKNRKQFFPYLINHKENLSKTLEIKDEEIIDKVLTCFAYIYVPNFKLREFKRNNYKTVEFIQSENDLNLAKDNIKIAKSGLYIAVIGALTSLVAIALTIYSLGIPATVKINDNQIMEIKKSILDANKSSKIDTLHIKR